MKDPVLNKFEGIEKEKRKEINSLMQEWEKAIPSIKIKFRDDNKNYPAKDYFAADGFFPGYFNQKNKLLFIGREARWMTSVTHHDYISTFMQEFFPRDNQNLSGFVRHLLYIVQGVKSKGILKFEEVKSQTADRIAKEMVKTNDYGFAVMNISKYSNDANDGANADIKLINTFLEHSSLDKRNFFQEELAILQPDIIITGNLWDGKIREEYLELCFGEKFASEKPKKSVAGIADLYEIEVAKRTAKLIDTYALSSRYSEKEYFYDPIMKLLFK